MAGKEHGTWQRGILTKLLLVIVQSMEYERLLTPGFSYSCGGISEVTSIRSIDDGEVSNALVLASVLVSINSLVLPEASILWTLCYALFWTHR